VSDLNEEHEPLPVVVDQSGRTLGPRAIQTRNRLLEATEKLLSREKLRDLCVIDIAREVGTSAATFYQYFRDADDAVLCLAEQASAEMPGILDLIEGSWKGEAGLPRARAIVEAFIAHWDAHYAVLRVRNLACDEGDARFQALRARTLRPVLTALARVIAVHRPDAPGHPAAAAAAMAAILERLAAYHHELEVFGVTRAHLVESSARILHHTVTGE
jgi:AcrR family transcriptional regulator